jgi:hypothetical protein
VTDNRIVLVNAYALKALNSAGLVPPDTGQFNIAELDAKLAGLDISERMRIKGHLRAAGLLPTGRPINDVRP